MKVLVQIFLPRKARLGVSERNSSPYVLYLVSEFLCDLFSWMFRGSGRHVVSYPLRHQSITCAAKNIKCSVRREDANCAESIYFMDAQHIHPAGTSKNLVKCGRFQGFWYVSKVSEICFIMGVYEIIFKKFFKHN